MCCVVESCTVCLVVNALTDSDCSVVDASTDGCVVESCTVCLVVNALTDSDCSVVDASTDGCVVERCTVCLVVDASTGVVAEHVVSGVRNCTVRNCSDCVDGVSDAESYTVTDRCSDDSACTNVNVGLTGRGYVVYEGTRSICM